MRQVAFATPTLVTALADSPAALIAAVQAGRSAVGPLEASWFGVGGLAGEVPLGARRTLSAEELDAEDDPTLRILGPHGRTLAALATPLHERVQGARVARERVGLYLALGMVDSAPADLARAVAASADPDAAGGIDWDRFYGGAFRQIHPLWPLSMLGNVAGGQLAIDLDVRGDNLALASDVDGGVRALLEATRAIERGTLDAALVGAVAEPIQPASLTRLALRGPVAHAGHPGHIPGEGGVCLWLEARDNLDGGAGRILRGTTAFEPDLAAGPVVGEALARFLDAAGAPTLTSVAYVPIGDPDVAQRQRAQIREASGQAPRADTPTAVGHLGPAAALLELACASQTAGTHLIVSCSSEGSLGFLLVEVD